MDRSSFFKWSGLPDAFGVVLMVFSLILLLAPYFAGADFGLFNIPTVTEGAKKLLRVIGPVFFILCILAFLPILSPHEESKSLIFDFLAAAPKAKWTSNFGANLLIWNDRNNAQKGFARYMNNPTLEDGSRPQNVLFTHPEMKDEGHIVGDFTLREEIQTGEHFRAQVGFL